MVSKGVIFHPEVLRPGERAGGQRPPIDRLPGQMIRLAAGQSMIRSVVAEPRISPPKRHRSRRAALLASLLVLATCGPTGESELRLAALGQARPAVEAAVPAHFT